MISDDQFICIWISGAGTGAGAGFAKPVPLPSLENFTSFKKLVIFIHYKKSSNNSKC